MDDVKKIEAADEKAVTTVVTPSARYEAPVVESLGTLEQLQAVGLNWRDGSRYKDNM